jgi:hypothetical protein
MGWVYFGVAILLIAALIGAAVGAEATGDLFGVLGGMCVGGFVGFLIALMPISYGQVHYNERTMTCKVQEKDRGGNDDGMRVYTSCGTFQNTDSWFRGKTDSGDLWARIHEGSEQQFTVVGWRLGLTSDFPNILEVK